MKMAINENRFFKKINAEAKPLSEWALTEALTRTDYNERFGFQSIWLDLDSVYKLCPEFKIINNIVKIDHVSVICMKPGDWYKPHTDSVRQASINMLLNHEDSVCAFIEPKTKQTVKLDYQPNTLYLFNTQKIHTVFNFTGDRYLLTIIFEHVKNTFNNNKASENPNSTFDYNNIASRLKEHKLV